MLIPRGYYSPPPFKIEKTINPVAKRKGKSKGIGATEI